MINDLFYVDGHHHLWKLDQHQYKWLTQDMQPIYRDFLPEDYCEATKSTSIASAILVQADPSFEESLSLLQTANTHEYISGVIGWVDFDDPKLAIRQLQQLQAHPKFLGVRPMIQDVAEVEWILNADFEPIFRYLVNERLCFEALVKQEHLGVLLTLLHRYPGLRVVIDHAAKPRIASAEFLEWSSSIKLIANTTNAYCKLSGLLTEASPEQQSFDSLAQYINFLIDVFLGWGPIFSIRGEKGGKRKF